jgi:hypothetical protein
VRQLLFATFFAVKENGELFYEKQKNSLYLNSNLICNQSNFGGDGLVWEEAGIEGDFFGCRAGGRNLDRARVKSDFD